MPRPLPYEESGAGEPILLIPGTGFGPSSWGEFGRLLAEGRRTIAYGRRGFTAAAPEPAESVGVHADDARSVLERAGAVPADVVGWSGGALIAVALAIEHRAACRSLLLIEPSLRGLRAVTPSALAMALRARATRILRGQAAATDLAYRWTFAYRGGGDNAWDAMPAEWREQVLTFAPAVAAEEAQETSLRYPSRAALSALDLPVTVAIGDRSQRYFHRIGRQLERLIPGARLASVAGASHAVHLDAPERTAALIPS